MVHRLPAQAKIVGAVGFVLVVVSTPSTERWAFVVYAVMVATTAGLARIPPGWLLTRLVIELPFVVFAVVLPFVALGPRTDVLGLSVSVGGLESAFGILVKGTLGVATSLLLAGTTELRALLAGLHRLRVPPLLIQIMAFMLRYAEVVSAETDRMRTARTARCFEARRRGRRRILAAAAGALFFRAYERGERVHLAMLSRGYSGGLPVLTAPGASATQWAAGAALPLSAAVVFAVTWLTA